MSDINQIITEILSNVSFLQNDNKTDRVTSYMMHSKNITNALDQNDIDKVAKASKVTGLSRNVTASLQKLTSGMGGIDRYLNKPSVDIPMLGKHAMIIRRKAAAKFNNIMGEKVV